MHRKVTSCVIHQMKAENVRILKNHLAGSKYGGVFAYGRFSHDVPIISYICIICYRVGPKRHIVTINTPNESILYEFSFFQYFNPKFLICILLICINTPFLLKTQQFHCTYFYIILIARKQDKHHGII